MHFLHHVLEALSPRNSNVSVLRKVVLDRLIFTPPYLLVFFFTVAILEVGQVIYFTAYLDNMNQSALLLRT